MKKSENSVVLLHLSDLHFGWDGDEKGRTDRDLALKGLLNVLSNLDTDWKPNCVCISGDIGWRGQRSDYESAKHWILNLLSTLKLSSEALFVCPGNHDVDRKAAKLNARPNTPQEADEILGTTPIPEHFQKPFQSFIEFCKDLGIPPLSSGDETAYLVGQRSYQGIYFISYNSAWFCKGDDDKGKLWIGLPQIKLLENKGHLPPPTQLHEWTDTVALLHHPREWFHEVEIRADENYHRPNTFDYLARRCHVLLTGHTHGEVRSADRFAEGAWHLSGGAAYAGASHFNSFRLIRIEDDRYIYLSFEYDPRSPDNSWRPVGGANSLPKKKAEILQLEQSATQIFDLTHYREKALEDANRFVETKSRALKSYGTLPETLLLAVSVHDKSLRYRFSPRGQLTQELKPSPSMSLLEAAKKDRRTLLLGDLGTGKSTLAGTLVKQILQENERSLAYIIPAKSFKFASPFTIKELLEAASTYFNSQISPTTSPISLEVLLKEQIEIALIVDGLDEIAISQAADLLSQLGTLVHHWPNIQILATGRPVELRGVNYEDWQVLSTISLRDDERMLFFEAEAIAEGKTTREAKSLARQLLDKLKTLPELDSLATTPLVVRLLYSKLLAIQAGQTFTLGDLLYDLVKERLGGWAVKDRKQSPAQHFEAKFPEENSRIALLGEFALEVEMQKSLAKEQAQLYLQKLIERRDGSNASALAQEALIFFEQSGIILVTDEGLQFPIQPFLEFLCGYSLAMLWQEKSETPGWLKSKYWRVVSFAATTLRRLGLIGHLRPRLLDFLQELLSQERNVPAASYIVSESQDKMCAEAFIENVSKLDLRPLTLFGDEPVQSARSIAETIQLAEQIGFDWLFERYLNPRYPIINTGSGVIDRVFEQWIYISFDRMTDYEKEQLSKLIIPHTQTGTLQLLHFIPPLALLIPDAFKPGEALWFCGSLLDKGLFSTRVEQYFRAAFEIGQRELVNNVLIKHAQRGYENAASAAWLWLTLNSSERPDTRVLKTLLRAYGRSRIDLDREEYIRYCIESVGPRNWEIFLRWCLFADDHYLAAGAAIELYQRGERRLSLLGGPLLRALHDGGYFKQAEDVLKSLVHEIGSRAVKWLASQIAGTERSRDSAHSGWWRVFLSELYLAGDEGPGLLAESVSGIGAYLLPRYPEVRQLFRDLLSGPQGTDYRDHLREQLFNLSPAARHGAAMVLIISDPKNESQALEVVAKLRRRKTFGLWNEWESFCLSLSFGPSVLAYLESKIPFFDSSAEVFALAILHRNRVKLDESRYEKLVKDLLELGNWGLDPQEEDLSVFANPASLEILVQVIEQGADENASRAAEELLRYHTGKLTPLLHAKCISLTMSGQLSWGPIRASEQIERMKTDPSYVEEVKEASAQIVALGGKRPLLELIREALTDEKAWEDVVWRLLCDDSHFSLGQEDNGQWLLEYGRLEPKYGVAIGKAAQKLLHDPRLEASPWGEVRQWLAILTDEFIGLSQNELKHILVQTRAIMPSAASALIARFDNNVPQGFEMRTSAKSVPPLLDSPEKPRLRLPEQFDKLRELARPSQRLHPDMCGILEELTLDTPLPNEYLVSLAAEGIHGVLMSSALSFVYGQPPNPKFIFELLYFPRNVEQPEDQCFNLLTRIWRNGHYTAIEEDEEAKVNYIKVLDEALIQDTDKTFAIASELLVMRGNLTKDQVKQAFDYYANHPEHNDFGLGGHLVKWFASDLDPQTCKTLIEAIERGLETLDGHPWIRDMNDEFRFLLFPLAYWKLTQKATELSIRVFLRGIKFTFALRSGGQRGNGPVEIMERIEPLLLQVPKPLLNEALIFGQTLDDPVIKSLCHLFVRYTL